MSPEQLALLTQVVDTVIPPSSARGMPGAGELGLAEALAARAELVDPLEAGLAAVASIALDEHGADFASLDAEGRRGVLERVGEVEPGFFSVVLSQTIIGYYADARVLVALGLEGHPPFPQGYAVAPTDLSILDPVRARAPFFKVP